MKNHEVMFNLWFVHGGDGIIYSLRVRAYLALGTEDQSLKLLRHLASTDYLIARPFSIPESFHVSLNSGEKMPVASTAVLNTLDTPIAIFEDAIKQMEKDFPAQSNVAVPAHPLVCVTPLLGDEQGNIRSAFTHAQRYDS
jgi:hypothetical protein